MSLTQYLYKRLYYLSTIYYLIFLHQRVMIDINHLLVSKLYWKSVYKRIKKTTRKNQSSYSMDFILHMWNLHKLYTLNNKLIVTERTCFCKVSPRFYVFLFGWINFVNTIISGLACYSPKQPSPNEFETVINLDFVSRKIFFDN